MEIQERKMKTREFVAYAIVPAVTMGSAVMQSFLSGYWTDVVGISAAAVAMIFLIARIFDGFTDIVMGAIIDKTHTKYGKAKPWYVIGSIGIMITTTLIFMTPELSVQGKIIYAAIMYMMVVGVFSTMCNVASPTLVNLVTRNSSERFKMGSWMFSMMWVTNLAVSFGLNIIAVLGGGQKGYFSFAAICNGIAVLLLIFFCMNLKEHYGQEEKKKEKVSAKEFLKTIFTNKYFLLVTAVYFVNNVSAGMIGGSTYYYVVYIMKDINAFAVLSIASYIPCIAGTMLGPVLGNKFGINKVVIIGQLVTSAVYAAILINPTNMPYVMTMIAIGSFANGPACAVLAPYNAMAADYGEYKFGVARPAVYSAGTSVGSKLGAGLGATLFTFLLALAKFDGMAEVQPAAANSVIIGGYAIAPAVAMLVFILLIIPFFKLEKEYPAICEELKKRREVQNQGE